MQTLPSGGGLSKSHLTRFSAPGAFLYAVVCVDDVKGVEKKERKSSE